MRLVVETKNGTKKPRKLFVIIAIVITLIAVGTTSTLIMANGGRLSNIKEKIVGDQEYVVALDDFIVNVSAENGTDKYVKTKISLVYKNKSKTKMLTEKTSQLRDVIINDFVRSSSQELLASGGLDNMKKKLQTDINNELGENVISGIYFTDFLIQ